MLASEIMTQGVVTVTPDTSITELASLLTEHGISAVPVVSGGRVVGMVSEGDLLRRAELGTQHARSSWSEVALPSETLAKEYTREHGRTVADVMTRDVVCVQHDAEIGDLADLLERRRIKRVPVLRDGALVGIVSRANLVQALAVRPLPERTPGAPSDLEIRNAVVAQLRQHRWGGFPTDVNVIVRGGVAHVFGTLRSEAEHRALMVAVENTAGVVELRDHMTYPPLRPRAAPPGSASSLAVHGE